MALPIFSRPAVPTVNLSQAPDFPSNTPDRRRQRRRRADGGAYKVTTMSAPERVFNLTWSEMDKTDHDALVAFLGHNTLNWSERPFYYTDHQAVQHQVRFLDGDFPAPEVAPGVFRVNMTLVEDRGQFD